MKSAETALVIFSCSLLTSTATSRLPTFRDYPVHRNFRGIPSPPKIIDSMQRKYAEYIIEGVEKGYGVDRDGREQKGPNFAGHYVVIRWGCGTTCVRMAIVDAVDGTVYFPPIVSDDVLGTHRFDLPVLLPPGYQYPQNSKVSFRVDSALMIIDATPAYLRPDPQSYRFYYLWSENRWIMLRKLRLR